MKDIKKICNPMVDLSKFTSNKKILSKVVALAKLCSYNNGRFAINFTKLFLCQVISICSYYYYYFFQFLLCSTFHFLQLFSSQFNLSSPLIIVFLNFTFDSLYRFLNFLPYIFLNSNCFIFFFNFSSTFTLSLPS